ncbi:hypothetical protein [uncultured Clostridium sp.]|uniref:radical SAM protein n=1 Tax=uncultured Clostridium sp. TaxID=59620 RepID=UPI0025EB92D7|nr:hypothetical protein [uncultured Clostridium sp.]
MSYKYFNLNPECYLILGKNKSVIQNLLTRDVIWLNEEETQLMIKVERGDKVDESNEYLNELAMRGFGFISEKRYYIDKIRTMNLFNQKKFWKDRPIVFSAILQLTNKCNMNCDQCNKIFCPICTKTLYDNDISCNVDIWEKTIDELIKFGLKNIILTGGEVTLYEGLNEIIDFSISRGLNVTISTNGLNKLEKLYNDVEIIINVFEDKQMNAIKENYSEFDNIKIFNYSTENIEKENINKNWEVIEVSEGTPTINIENILKTDLILFDANKYNNSCLKSKIYITSNLNVIPCFGDRTSIIGNVLEDGISTIIYKLSTNYWNKPKVKYKNNHKCGNCEFRYSCSVCTNLNADENCNYRMELGEWK